MNHGCTSSSISLLLDHPWRDLLGSNVFSQYSARQQLIDILTLRSSRELSNEDHEALVSARLQWLSSAVDRVLMDLDVISAEPYLGIFHALFKSWRKSQSSSHTGQQLLALLENHENIQQWISRSLTSQNIPPSFLHCMIDIIKISLPDHLAVKIPLYEVSPLWQHSNISIVRRSLELVARILQKYPNYYETTHVLEQLILFANHVAAHLTRQQLKTLFDPERTEFFYSPVNDSITIDRESLKLAAQIFVASLKQYLQSPSLIQTNTTTAAAATQQKSIIIVQQMLQQIKDWTRHQSYEVLLEFIFEIFGNDDFDAVNFQQDILDIYTLLSSQAAATQQQQEEEAKNVAFLSQLLTDMCVHPHYLFLHFCQRTGMDHELLLDLLLTDESNFLLFLARYLKYVEADPKGFASVCDKQDQRNAVRSMLLQLRSALIKPGFPYNAKPLVNRMNRVLLHL